MGLMKLENDAFLTKLTDLFQKSKSSGSSESVRVVMKRHDGRDKPVPRTGRISVPEYKCLFRATHGSIKIRTVVAAKDVNKFHMAFANILKANMDGLKKRERKTKGKSKPKAT